LIGIKSKSEFSEEEGDQILKLMSAWKRRGYDEGKAEGYEEAKKDVIHKLLSKGFDPEKIADALELPVDEVKKAQVPEN